LTVDKVIAMKTMCSFFGPPCTCSIVKNTAYVYAMTRKSPYFVLSK